MTISDIMLNIKNIMVLLQAISEPLETLALEGIQERIMRLASDILLEHRRLEKIAEIDGVKCEKLL